MKTFAMKATAAALLVAAASLNLSTRAEMASAGVNARSLSQPRDLAPAKMRVPRPAHREWMGPTRPATIWR